MLLTCVQSDVTFADISANIQRVLNWLDTAPVQNSDLVVFPECMLSGYAYDSRDEALNHAMDLNDVRFEPLIKAGRIADASPVDMQKPMMFKGLGCRQGVRPFHE